MNLFELFVKLGVQDEASDKISGLSNKLKTGLGKAAKIGTAAIAAVGTASVAAGKKLWDMANQTAQLGDNIDKNSQRLGLSYEAFQKWDYVMQISGSSIDSAAMGMKTLTKAVDGAKQGTASAIEKFTRLGLTMEDLQGLSREEIFEKVVFALQGVSDETEKAALATELLGRSGQELLPMLNSTEEDLRTLMSEAQNYGMIMSDDAVRASAAFQDALTKLTHTVDGVKNSITANLLPGLTDIINGFADLVNGTEGAGDKIKSGISNVIAELKKMIPQIIEVVSTIVSAVAESAPEIISALATGVIQAIPELLSSLGTAISKTATEVINLFHSPEQIEELSQTGGDMLQAVIDGIGALLGNLATTASDIVKALADGIPKAVKWLIDSAASIIDSISEYLGKKENRDKLLESAEEIVDQIGKGIIDTVKNLGQAAVDLIKGLCDFLVDKDRMDELGETAGQIVGQIVKKIIEFAVDLVTAGAEILKQLGDYFLGEDADGKFDKMGENILGAIWTAMVAAWDEVLPTLEKIDKKLRDFFENIDWEETANKLITNLLESMIRKSVRQSYELKRFWENLKNWVLKIDWSAVGQSILDTILNTMTFGIYGLVTGKTGENLAKATAGAGKAFADVNSRVESIRDEELRRLEYEEKMKMQEAVNKAMAEQQAQQTAPYVNVNINAVPQSPSEIYNEFQYGLRAGRYQ